MADVAEKDSYLTTPKGVVEHMESSTSERDWNDRCDQVKAANDGYPSFWYSAVVLSGVMARTIKNP